MQHKAACVAMVQVGYTTWYWSLRYLHVQPRAFGPRCVYPVETSPRDITYTCTGALSRGGVKGPMKMSPAHVKLVYIYIY